MALQSLPESIPLLDRNGITRRWIGFLRALKQQADVSIDTETLAALGDINRVDVGAIQEDLRLARLAAPEFPPIPPDSPLAALLFEKGTAPADLSLAETLVSALTPGRPWSEIQVQQDTWANRAKYPAAAVPNGSLLRITDKRLVFAALNGAWSYAAGTYSLAQTAIAALVATLTTADAGLLLWVTDFKHTLVWDGSALDFAPGDDGSNYFIDAPSAPLGKTVQLCDGTTVTYLKADGTTGSYVTQNLTGHFRKSVTSGADATVAAVAPGLSGSTAAASTGITVADHPSHTHDDASSLATPDLFAADTSGAGVAGRTGGPSATLQHPVTDPQHSHAKGTLAVDATGEPAAYKVLTYFRR